MMCADAEVSDARDSCKSAFALALLQQLAGQGHKALVFSQSRRMLDLLAGLLSAQGLKLLRIDGALSASERQVSCARHHMCHMLRGWPPGAPALAAHRRGCQGAIRSVWSKLHGLVGLHCTAVRGWARGILRLGLRC